MAERSIAVDLWKVLAICIVVLIHTQAVCQIDMVIATMAYLINIGVGLFIFASGYLLYRHHSSFSDRAELMLFYRKRLFRIIPLYWAVLLTSFVLVPSLFLDKNSIFVYLSGLQIIAGNHIEPNVFWFVGLVLAYYAMFPLFAHLAKRPLLYISITILIFIAFALCSHMIGAIDARFFMYYFIFIMSIQIASRTSIGTSTRPETPGSRLPLLERPQSPSHSLVTVIGSA